LPCGTQPVIIRAMPNAERQNAGFKRHLPASRQFGCTWTHLQTPGREMEMQLTWMLLLGLVALPGGEKADVPAESLKTHFRPLFARFGQASHTKIKVLCGPKEVKMRNGGVAGISFQVDHTGCHRRETGPSDRAA